MKAFCMRLIKVVFGLFLFALGIYLSIQANVGLAPWDAFSIGIAGLTGLTYGQISVLSGLVILGIDTLLKEKIGVGTILNTLLIGLFVDLLQWVDIIPLMSNFFAGVVVLLLGQFIICLGSYFYIGPGLGCGPRDSLMVALGKRLKKVPIGAVRGIIEASALLIGWLLGAKVGIGTVIAVFGISFILQATFRVLHFNVKDVVHESVIQTAKDLVKPREPEKQEQETE